MPSPEIGVRHRRAWRVGLLLVTALFLGACATRPAPQLDDDIEAFTAGIDAMLQTGMTIQEARTVLRERMPPASMNTEVTAPVPSANRANRMRRFMIGWPTFTHNTTFIVTIFCDREGRIVRWTTGPLTENR